MPSLMAVLGLNANPFKRALLESQADARHAGKEIKEAFGEFITEKLPFATAGGAIAAMEEIARRSIEWGEKISNLANRLGISTDAIQLWDHALRQNGSSIESATGFFEKLGMARQKAMQGSEKETDAFKRLGVSMEDLKSKRIEDIAGQIARVFEEGDPQKLISDLRILGGRGAGEMVAAFRGGLGEMVSGNQTELRLVSEEDIALLKEAADVTRTIWDNVKGAGATFTAILVKGTKDLVHDIDVIIHGSVGAIDGYFGALGDSISKLFKGQKQTAAEAAFGPLKAAAKEASELAHAYDDKSKAKDSDSKTKRDKMKAGLVGGEEETEDAKAAKQAQKTAEEILRINQETARIKQATALREMSHSERVEEIERRIGRVKSEMQESIDEKDFAQSELNLAKLSDELDRAKDESKKDQDRTTKEQMRSHRFRSPDVNDRQRIGAYAPGVEIGAAQAAIKSEGHLGDILKELRTHGKVMRRSGY